MGSGKQPAARVRRGPSLLAAAFWLALIAALTLRPDPDAAASGVYLEPVCLVCGDRGLADALLNIALFVPLGLALARAIRPRQAVIVGALASALIELAQGALPGRFSTWGDVASNAAGTALGALAWGAAPRLRALSRPWRIGLASALFAAVVLAPAVLLAPSFPEGAYFAQWAPSLPNPRVYRGEVLWASVGGRETPIGLQPQVEELRSALQRGDPIHIRFQTAPPSVGLSPLYRLADARNRTITTIGISGNDLVVSERTWAATLTLETPPAVWSDALTKTWAADTVGLRLRKEEGKLCVDLDGRTSCELAPSVGLAGWQLLWVTDPARPSWRSLPSIGWIGLPAVLLGVTLGPGVGALIGALAAAAVVALAGTVSPWLKFEVLDVMVAAAAVIAGAEVLRHSKINPHRLGESPSQ